MNNNKFCFIICTNDNTYLEECLHYINHITVPDGYKTEIITVSEAPSMTEGYNSAMKSSDAKYKIYLHQDVFILNKNFLSDILRIFKSDSKIGMIGMAGYQMVAPDGIMWHTPRVGGIYIRKDIIKYPPLEDYIYVPKKDGYYPVALVDGLLIATAYDLPWNTEELKDWDFYDAFQSMEFLLNGYRIVVPKQRHPWCLHDDNRILTLFNYDKNRQLFLKKYKAYLGKQYSEIP